MKTKIGQATSNRCLIVVIAVLLLNGIGQNSHALTNATLPNVEQIVEKAVNYAIANEDTNTIRFNQHYRYARDRNWVHRKEDGRLTELKQTRTEENATQTNLVGGELGILVKGRDLKLNSYPISNIISRFDFTLIGEESVDGRPAYVIEFVPHKSIPIRQLKDPFINRATGTVWIDQEDYAVSKASFHLNSPVKAGYGVVGQVNDFSGKISRSRTSEGYWHVRRMDWHLDERILGARRIIDYYEERIHQLPIKTVPSIDS